MIHAVDFYLLPISSIRVLRRLVTESIVVIQTNFFMICEQFLLANIGTCAAASLDLTESINTTQSRRRRVVLLFLTATIPYQQSAHNDWHDVHEAKKICQEA